MVRLAVTLVLLALLATPLAAQAQPAGKVVRIGVLVVAPGPGARPWEIAFRAGLRELGYIEGQNLILDWAEGK